jgi:hypothetical protein
LPVITDFDFMSATVFLTVLSGVLTYVLGQLIVKLVIDPVQEAKRTIAQIAHVLIERANVIANPGVLPDDVMAETAKQLRQLSSQLNTHLYLVPRYKVTSKLFALPPVQNVLKCSSFLIGLSNSLARSDEKYIEWNAKRVEAIHDLLGIHFEEGRRWPKDVP